MKKYYGTVPPIVAEYLLAHGDIQVDGNGATIVTLSQTFMVFDKELFVTLISEIREVDL